MILLDGFHVGSGTNLEKKRNVTRLYLSVLNLRDKLLMASSR